jgi:quercetin dioxygenase-like cupin family protein
MGGRRNVNGTARAVLSRAEATRRIEADWGGLVWYASAEIGNSQALTVGTCRIRPGCRNPAHSHPNCEEVLVVVRGRIMHAVGDGQEVAMGPGDTITIPLNMPHYARNVGTEDAVMTVVFSSGDRRMHSEE